MASQPDKPNVETDDVPESSQNGELQETLPGSLSQHVTNDVDKKQIAQFVTTIKNSEQQVGENIIAALQHENTVAVLTTVVIGPDGNQRVISAALDPQRMKQVQEILSDAEAERVDEEPCFGFHCLVKPKTPETLG
ncbi:MULTISPECIES: hypothetical protein [Pirellulaceae]|uniref:Uncharacterized protein n=1 Tax=Aporhodopirellula rubra TaxID=980271 RepID=A0A7W5E548_9BACT|nr:MULTISPECIES: hypothetical protein [Pirellulaceae]EMI45064.1 hypothetical protein RRSWK_02485 [Rhodopirellula sp. SWK7]MBB3209997.1 hypothetical protein [Aporhodopirellula rubra]